MQVAEDLIRLRSLVRAQDGPPSPWFVKNYQFVSF